MIDFGAVRSAVAGGGVVPAGWLDDERAARYVRDMVPRRDAVVAARVGAAPRVAAWEGIWHDAVELGVACRSVAGERAVRRDLFLPALSGARLAAWREQRASALVAGVVEGSWSRAYGEDLHMLALLRVYAAWRCGEVDDQALRWVRAEASAAAKRHAASSRAVPAAGHAGRALLALTEVVRVSAPARGGEGAHGITTSSVSRRLLRAVDQVCWAQAHDALSSAQGGARSDGGVYAAYAEQLRRGSDGVCASFLDSVFQGAPPLPGAFTGAPHRGPG